MFNDKDKFPVSCRSMVVYRSCYKKCGQGRPMLAKLAIPYTRDTIRQDRDIALDLHFVIDTTLLLFYLALSPISPTPKFYIIIILDLHFVIDTTLLFYLALSLFSPTTKFYIMIFLDLQFVIDTTLLFYLDLSPFFAHT